MNNLGHFGDFMILGVWGRLKSLDGKVSGGLWGGWFGVDLRSRVFEGFLDRGRFEEDVSVVGMARVELIIQGCDCGF
jgi:hypothetical protein